MNNRIVSIDVFRGLTMLLMIFVNDLAGVTGLPWWNYHVGHGINGMTYVDMVFPTFLFIVGLSLPLAFEARMQRGATVSQLWRHILARTAGLLVLGIALANAEKCTSMPPNLWGFLVLVSGILFWLTNPRFRWVGLAGLLILFSVFRRSRGQWLDFSYWEILGLIGWSYLVACVLYLATRKWKIGPLLWLVATCTYNAVRLPQHDYAAFVSLIFAGIVCTQLVFIERRAAWMTVCYAALLVVAGGLLMPLGISKLRATPSWCLFTAATAVLLLLALHYLCDIRGWTDWAAWVRPAGSNTILTYLVPDLYYFGVVVPWLPGWLNSGIPGAFRAAAFTGVMLAISALLTKLGIRMQL